MAVDVEGDADAGMPEALLHHFGMHALTQKLRPKALGFQGSPSRPGNTRSSLLNVGSSLAQVLCWAPR